MLHVTERKRIYDFLATLFSYPDQELIERLQGDEPGIISTLILNSQAPPLAWKGLLRELEIAYTDLFINRLGGAPALPYGSLYFEEEGNLMGQSTLHVGEAYRSEGLSMDESGEPPDFLPTEMEFLYYLVDKEESALKTKDIASARKATESQAVFCRTLLRPWIPIFCGRIEKEKEAHPLYRWAGQLLDTFFRMEQDWLQRLL